MKIELEIYSAAEFAAFAQFAASMAGARHIQDEENMKVWASDMRAETAVGAVTAVLAETAAPPAVVDPPAEVKKTRTTKKAETAPVTTTTTETPPAITPEEIKSSILDLLNDWTEAAPTDANIRVNVLTPLLKALDAAKIKEIDPARYPEVAGLIDDSRAEMAAFKAASAPTEEE